MPDDPAKRYVKGVYLMKQDEKIYQTDELDAPTGKTVKSGDRVVIKQIVQKPAGQIRGELENGTGSIM